MRDDHIDLQSSSYTPDRLLDEVMWVTHAKNRNAMARLLEIDPGLMCRTLHRQSPITCGFMVRIMDRTGWGIKYVRELAGIPYDGPVCPPRPRGVIILTKTPRNYHLAKEHVQQAMPGTVEQLARKSGYARGTVEFWLKVLRAGDPLTRASHIVDWLPPTGPRGEGPYAPVHAAGPGEDAVCIRPHRRDRRRSQQRSAAVAIT